MPKLRLLGIRGDPETETLRFLDEALPHVQVIDIEHASQRTEWSPTEVPAARLLVSKIRNLSIDDCQMLWKIIRDYPSFAPEVLNLPYRRHGPVASLWERDWEILCMLPSLKHLDIKEIRSSSFLCHGFPPNLEKLTAVRTLVGDLCQPEQQLPELARVLAAAQGRIRFDMRLAYKGYPRSNPTDAELAFWETVRGVAK